MSLYLTAFIYPSILTTLPVSATEKHTQASTFTLHCGDGVGHVLFTKEWLQSIHSSVQAWLKDCSKDLLEGPLLPTGEDWSSERGSFPSITQFWQPASSRKSSGGSKVLPFMDGGGRAYWESNTTEMFLYPFPDLCLEMIPSLTSCLSSVMHCQLWDLL